MNRIIGAAAGMATAWTAAHLRSTAVRRWQASTLPIRHTAGLAYRHGGDPDRGGILLIHGMVATGDVFGTTPDVLAADRRVLAPDLLGFGRSLDESRVDFSTEAHLDALDELIDHELPEGPIAIGAHSMGSAFALRLALRHPDRVRQVVCIGAPAWPTPDAARESLGRLGAMSRALLFDERIARRLCHFNCTNRTLAGYLSAVAAPRWPIPIARQASLHTWPAYMQTLTDQIIDCPWDRLIRQLDDHKIPVTFLRGDRDPIGDPAFMKAIAARLPTVSVQEVPGDHTLPAAMPQLLTDALQ